MWIVIMHYFNDDMHYVFQMIVDFDVINLYPDGDVELQQDRCRRPYIHQTVVGWK